MKIEELGYIRNENGDWYDWYITRNGSYRIACSDGGRVSIERDGNKWHVIDMVSEWDADTLEDALEKLFGGLR